MNVGIVGAGIIGQLLALACIKSGHHVTVFEANDPLTNCSMAAAGLLTPLSELEKSNLSIYQLGKEALDNYWPKILAELPTSIYFQRNGSLLLSHPQDKPDLNRCIRRIDDKLQTTGYRQKLNQQGLVALEPALSKFEEGYYFPDEAHIDNQSLLGALQQHLLMLGARWQVAQVDRIAPGKIYIQQDIRAFDWVLDCRGMGAPSAFPALQGIRGELIWLHAPSVAIKRPIHLKHPRYPLYIVPRPNHRYLIGATEIPTENYDPISVRSTLELLTAAYYVHPGFAEARIEKTITHCRPTLPDYLPKIIYTDGLIAINGLYRHGFLIAPTLCAEVMGYLENKT